MSLFGGSADVDAPRGTASNGPLALNGTT